MITKAIGYQTSKGEIFPTIEAAKLAELKSILGESELLTSCEVVDFATWILDHSEKFIDILTTGPKSRPKARAANGAKRRIKKAVRHEAEQFEMPLAPATEPSAA